MDPALAQAGSLIFTMTEGPIDLDHPVAHAVHQDAAAYAAWAGKSLPPTEAEFEYAARGGLEGREYAWGDELAPGGRHLASSWQGAFPFANTAEDGWIRTSPVRSYAREAFRPSPRPQLLPGNICALPGW